MVLEKLNLIWFQGRVLLLPRKASASAAIVYIEEMALYGAETGSQVFTNPRRFASCPVQANGPFLRSRRIGVREALNCPSAAGVYRKYKPVPSNCLPDISDNEVYWQRANQSCLVFLLYMKETRDVA